MDSIGISDVARGAASPSTSPLRGSAASSGSPAQRNIQRLPTVQYVLPAPADGVPSNGSHGMNGSVLQRDIILTQESITLCARQATAGTPLNGKAISPIPSSPSLGAAVDNPVVIRAPQIKRVCVDEQSPFLWKIVLRSGHELIFLNRNRNTVIPTIMQHLAGRQLPHEQKLSADIHLIGPAQPLAANSISPADVALTGLNDDEVKSAAAMPKSPSLRRTVTAVSDVPQHIASSTLPASASTDNVPARSISASSSMANKLTRTLTGLTDVPPPGSINASGLSRALTSITDAPLPSTISSTGLNRQVTSVTDIPGPGSLDTTGLNRQVTSVTDIPLSGSISSSGLTRHITSVSDAMQLLDTPPTVQLVAPVEVLADSKHDDVGSAALPVSLSGKRLSRSITSVTDDIDQQAQQPLTATSSATPSARTLTSVTDTQKSFALAALTGAVSTQSTAGIQPESSSSVPVLNGSSAGTAAVNADACVGASTGQHDPATASTAVSASRSLRTLTSVTDSMSSSSPHTQELKLEPSPASIAASAAAAAATTVRSINTPDGVSLRTQTAVSDASASSSQSGTPVAVRSSNSNLRTLTSISDATAMQPDAAVSHSETSSTITSLDDRKADARPVAIAGVKHAPAPESRALTEGQMEHITDDIHRRLEQTERDRVTAKITKRNNKAQAKREAAAARAAAVAAATAEINAISSASSNGTAADSNPEAAPKKSSSLTHLPYEDAVALLNRSNRKSSGSGLTHPTTSGSTSSSLAQATATTAGYTAPLVTAPTGSSTVGAVAAKSAAPDSEAVSSAPSTAAPVVFSVSKATVLGNPSIPVTVPGSAVSAQPPGGAPLDATAAIGTSTPSPSPLGSVDMTPSTRIGASTTFVLTHMAPSSSSADGSSVSSAATSSTAPVLMPVRATAGTSNTDTGPITLLMPATHAITVQSISAAANTVPASSSTVAATMSSASDPLVFTPLAHEAAPVSRDVIDAIVHQYDHNSAPVASSAAVAQIVDLYGHASTPASLKPTATMTPLRAAAAGASSSSAVNGKLNVPSATLAHTRSASHDFASSSVVGDGSSSAGSDGGKPGSAGVLGAQQNTPNRLKVVDAKDISWRERQAAVHHAAAASDGGLDPSHAAYGSWKTRMAQSMKQARGKRAHTTAADGPPDMSGSGHTEPQHGHSDHSDDGAGGSGGDTSDHDHDHQHHHQLESTLPVVAEVEQAVSDAAAAAASSPLIPAGAGTTAPAGASVTPRTASSAVEQKSPLRSPDGAGAATASGASAAAATASPSRSATVANQPVIHDLWYGGVLSKKDRTGLIKRWQPRSFYITREGTLWWTRPVATGAGAAAVPANSPQALMPPDAPSCTVVGLVVNAEDGHALGFDLLTSTMGDSKGDASAAGGAVLPMHVRAETVELKREWVRYVQQLVKEHTAAVRLRQQQQQQQH